MTNINVPSSLKSLGAYIKTANEMEKRDPVVSYYCRLYSVQRGMEIDRKSTESKKFLMELMDKLDKTKNELKDNESIISEVVGQAHLEEYALRLFAYADKKDKEGDFGQATVSSFITSGYLMDVLGVFGEVSEDMEKCRKYAKWKAVYITQCLKNGEVPHCGPLEDRDQIANANGMFPNQPSVTTVPPSAAKPQQPQNPPRTQSPSTQPQNPPNTQPQNSPRTQPQNLPNTPPQNPPNTPPQNPPRIQPQSPPNTQPQNSPRTQPQNPTNTQPQNSPGTQPPITNITNANKPMSANTPKPTSTPTQAYGSLSSEDFALAEKYCRYATSALQYQDAETAITYVRQCLDLLSRGKR